MLSDKELAYLAGIVDGEGHITLAAKAKDTSGNTARPLLQIGITDVSLVVWVKQRFPDVGIYIKKSKNSKHKSAHMMIWRSAKAVEVLKSILPYLVIKKTQAEVVTSYWDLEQSIWTKVDNFHINAPILPEVSEARKVAWTQLKELNKKGPAEVIH